MSKDLLGAFEQKCLLALIQLGDNAYGRTIVDELHDRTGQTVSLGQIYVTLERLQEKGMTTSRFGESTPTRGGKAKRYFKITALGEQALARSLEHLDRMRFGFGFDSLGART